MNDLSVSVEDRLAHAKTQLATCEQIDVPVMHTFAPGAYARTVNVPADTMMVSKRHGTEHIAILSYGECYVASQHGTERLIGPTIFVTPANTQRVVYCKTDVVWTTFHVTDETDVEKIEHDIIIQEP